MSETYAARRLAERRTKLAIKRSRSSANDSARLARRLGRLMAKDYKNANADAHHTAVEELTWKLIRSVLGLTR